jgi:hypothetical protein
MKLNDCYKIILTDLCDFSTSWTGYNSKWIDNCDLSNDALVKLVDLNLYQNFQNFPLVGTTSATSHNYCYALPGIGTSYT